jgi:hypothetical protein
MAHFRAAAVQVFSGLITINGETVMLRGILPGNDPSLVREDMLASVINKIAVIVLDQQIALWSIGFVAFSFRRCIAGRRVRALCGGIGLQENQSSPL